MLRCTRTTILNCLRDSEIGTTTSTTTSCSCSKRRLLKLAWLIWMRTKSRLWSLSCSRLRNCSRISLSNARDNTSLELPSIGLVADVHLLTHAVDLVQPSKVCNVEQRSNSKLFKKITKATILMKVWFQAATLCKAQMTSWNWLAKVLVAWWEEPANQRLHARPTSAVTSE